MEKKTASNGGFWMIVEELPQEKNQTPEGENKQADSEAIDPYNFYPDNPI